jgi:hypothetical protein
MLGLRGALIAQGKHEEAHKFATELTKAWSRSDVKPTSTWLCLPRQP